MDLAEAKARGYDAPARHPWELARVDVVSSLIRRHAPLGSGSIVLDVGCGDTFVVERLAAEHRDSWFYAVDTAFSDELVSRYRARLNNPRILPFRSLDAITPPMPRPASLVLLMDVIEHVADDGVFLSDLTRRPCVGAGTRFLVTVPAYQSLFSSHDTFLGHYRRYSTATLRSGLEGAGLRVLATGYFFASLLPIRVLQVLRERLLGAGPGGGTTGLVTWNGSAATTTILRRLLRLDAEVAAALARAGLTLPGLSGYAVCVKSA